MQNAETAAAPKTDRLIGVCRAIGDDFGFNPDFLRIAFAVALIFDPKLTLLTYAALGVAVLLSKALTWRRRRPAAKPQEAARSAWRDEEREAA
ncbi:MAG TPA: PspC domain-containing protein [Sphingomonas sp.]|nr:PspC domain-containing protein [Sphingomonas sp.]